MPATSDRSASSEPTPTHEVVDFGAHFYSNRLPHRPAKFDAFDDLVGPAYSEPEPYAEVQAAAGITGAVLVAPLYVQRGAGPGTGVDEVAEANDALLDVVRAHDHFVGGLAAIPFNASGEAAAAEFERCLDAGFDGGVIETINDDGVELVDAAVEPILEVADRTGAPVMVHPRARSSMDPEHDVLGDRYRGNSIFGREVTLMDSLCKVVHEGVLDRYPGLNLVYDHIGGNLASNFGRLEYQLDTDRWPGDHEHVKDWSEFRAQVEERIYLKLSGYFGYHAPVRAALEEFPSSSILFGTDFPMEVRDAEELRRCLRSVDDLTSQADARNVFSANARDLLVNLD